MTKEIGITDIPCCEEAQDMLDIKKYVGGLEKFIKECPTPMSIAIQGDWGTGKTSTINMLQKRLEDGKRIKCVYFNTWQYSQFRMADDLYMSFIHTLVRKCCSKEEKAKEIMRFCQSICSQLFYSTIKENTGLHLEEIFKRQTEKMENVEKLKGKFEEMVKEEVKEYENGRIVVFIDDLDRLNPEVAVELLEVIKLFMDVEKCIFVLAIDYEVVVSGVRGKYGQNVSEEKCRNFFDKIIQLPFRLPVESYSIESLIRNTVSNEIIKDDDIEALSDFVADVLGSNPRAYKRLANSFFLIKNVNDTLQNGQEQQLDNVLIFGSLCIQMCVPKFYQLLVAVTNEKEFKEVRSISTEEALNAYLVKQKLDLEIDKKDQKIVLRTLLVFNEFLKNIQGTSEKVIYIHLSGVLQMTAITSVSTSDEQRKRAKPIKVNNVIINEQEFPVVNPTEAILKVYRELLENDKIMIEEFCLAEERILTKDRGRTDSYFRNSKELCELGENKVYIGLSSSTNDKIKYTKKLCDFVKGKNVSTHVVWKYNDIVVFDSDIV